MHVGHLDTATATRRALLLGLAAAAAVPLVGCGGEDGGPELVTAAGVDHVAPPADAPVGATADGLTAFGHRVFQAAAEPGKNFVASPLSIALAFSMVRAGAGGTTAKELDSVFGFPATGRDQAYNAISARLATVDIPPEPEKGPRDPNGKRNPPVVSIGNALFPRQGLTIGADFLRTLAEQYAAGVRPVDFGGDATKQINAWVDRQTAGRIKEVFDTLPASTMLVLANTIYFKADWRAYFLDVADAAFTPADGTVIQTPTMRASLRTRYAETGGVTAVELPYAEGPYAMWLILPPPGGKPEDTLAGQVLARLRGSFTEQQVEVAFPKWDFASDIDLGTVLPALGVKEAFGGGADFSGISPGLFIAKAVHKANITVDEYGTEAAAVTGIAMAMSGPPTPTARFVADRPFAFAIVGGPDRIPLFIGRVSDPSAK
ncbi:serine proteinase inhibitor [Catellatospora methionotrophica]|uniref:Serine proteinase inhibitor n=1 Tax=Catellatospora methionotrophica TaxID=121620 RepID=A0A8J3LLK6_9ACTN|nr:serpin family protein [Catellatospora methionotrophica]GIG14910.1 serine proteinase inhibitor [Catellatospora methionotrophica]